MSNARHHKIDSDQPTVYQLRLKGHLGPQWADWFGGLSITSADNSDTLLTGPVTDQAALHALLKRVLDLGMTLVSVGPVQPDAADPSKGEEPVQQGCAERRLASASLIARRAPRRRGSI